MPVKQELMRVHVLRESVKQAHRETVQILREGFDRVANTQLIKVNFPYSLA